MVTRLARACGTHSRSSPSSPRGCSADHTVPIPDDTPLARIRSMFPVLGEVPEHQAEEYQLEKDKEQNEQHTETRFPYFCWF